MRSNFFANPKKTSAVVFATSTFLFLFPTCLKLVPLGNDESDAKKRLDDTQDAYDKSSQELSAINESINKAKQKVSNLDCAISGYPLFSQGVTDFQKRINNANLTPIESLSSFWGMHFDSDKAETTQTIVSKRWDDSQFKYENYYSCFWHNCGKDQNCCYDWGFHMVTDTYYYNEITTINNKYQNLLEGSAGTLPQLSCGDYSLQFQISSPLNYIVYESPHINRGDKRAGTIYVDFDREYSSYVTGSYKSNNVITNSKITVLRPANQNEAAADLAAKLYGFLATAIAAFNMAGANYPAIQSGIRGQISGLLDKAAATHAVLSEEALVLANQTAQHEEAGENFKNEMLLWLPLFFLVPGGLALLAYLFLNNCKDQFENQYAELDDVESGYNQSNNYTSSQPASAYASHATHFKNPVRNDIEPSDDNISRETQSLLHR